MPIPVATRYKAWVCGLSLARIADWNCTEGMDACLCYHLEVSAIGQSLVQRSPTEGSVSECNLENSALRSRRLTRGCRAVKKMLRCFQNLPLRKNNFVKRIKVMMLTLHTY